MLHAYGDDPRNWGKLLLLMQKTEKKSERCWDSEHSGEISLRKSRDIIPLCKGEKTEQKTDSGQ